MNDNVAFIYKEYRIEFGSDGVAVSGEAYYPGETMPVGRVNGHFYNSKDKNDKSHKKDNTLHIDLLIVSDKHSNKGLGTTLMKMTMLYAEKRKVKHVTTSPSPIGNMTTKQLEKFYRKFHFSTGIMVKKIEFVDDDDFLDEMEEEEIELIELQKRTSEYNPHVHVERATEQIDPFKPADNAILQDNIEEAFKLLDEEVDKINARKEILKEISGMTDEGELDDELEDELDGELEDEEDSIKVGIERELETTSTISGNYNNIGVLTTIYFVEERLPKKSKILDITGNIIEHSTYFSNKGHQISVPQGMELSKFEDNSFNVVLCIGPMDGVFKREEQKKIFKECYRICKEGGRIFISFPSNDMVIVDNIINGNNGFLKSENVDRKTMKVLKSEKNVLTMDEMDDFIEELMEENYIKYIKRFALDGISGLMQDKVNNMTEKQFSKWMKYHLYSCEKEEILGYSSSIVYIVKKQ